MRKLLLCVWLIACSVSAQIEWRQKEVTVQVHPIQLKAEAEFHFTNAGSEPISISEVQITCGCMAVRPRKPSYVPGEEGVLTIILDLKERSGLFHKVATVTSSDGETVELAVTASIPTAYETETKMIKWAEGDRSETKTVRLKNPNSMPIRLLSVSSSNHLLPAELKPVREGYEYEVIITRMPGAEKARSVLRIATEPPPGFTESKTVKLYAHAL
jgi:hypothetical protein